MSASLAAAAPSGLRVLMLLDKPFRTDLRVEREIRALLDAGHEVRLLCEADPGEPAQGAFGAASVRRFVRPRTLPQRWRSYLGGFLRGRSVFWEEWLQAEGGQWADVVHCHDLPVTLTGLRFARAIGALGVFDRHEDWPGLLEGLRDAYPPGLKRGLLWATVNSPRWWRHWERRALREADLVITVSAEARDDLPVQPAAPVVVVSNYVDVDLLSPPTPLPPLPPLRLCFLGVLNSMFALRDTLEGVALLDPGRVQVTFVGDGDERAPLQEMAERLGLSKHVSFTGWLPRQQALDAVSASHVGLLPLRDNPLTRTTIGNKLFEYLGLGRPVLCSGVGVMSRIAADTGGGVIVEPWTARNVAEALDRLCREPAELAELGRRGHAAVASTYNWSRERERLVRAYDALAARRRNPSDAPA